MHWTFSNSSVSPNCTVSTVDKSSACTKKTLGTAANYANIALIMNDSDFTKAGCTTKEQVQLIFTYANIC